MTTIHVTPTQAGLALEPQRLFASSRARWIGGLILAGYLLGLVALEASNDTTYPLALVVATLTVYAGLCALNLEAAFAVVLALTPFSVELGFRGAGGALQIPTEPMLFLALGAWAFRMALRRSTTLAHPRLIGALLLALGACLISAVGAAHRLAAIKAVISTSWYALFGIFLMNNCPSEARLKGLAAALALPTLAITAWSLLHVLAGVYDRPAGYWSAGPFFTEHGSFSAYLSFGLALLLALALESRGTTRIVLWLAACLVALQTFLSMTRGAWLGMAALFFFVGVLNWRRLLRPGYLALLLVTLACAGTLFVASGMSARVRTFTRTTSQVNYTSNLERVNRWYAGLRMFQSSPITGVGWGTYPDEYNHFRRFPAGTDQSSMRMGIHSEYFRVFVETGVIGGACALLVAVLVVGLAARAIRGAESPLRRGLAIGWSGGLITYAVHGVVNNFMAYDKVAMPVWSAVGGLAALVLAQARSEPGQAGRG